MIALLSNDDGLADVIRAAVELPWRLERHLYNGEVLEFLRTADVQLVIVDDEAVNEVDRGWLLSQVRRNFGAALLYVAGNHSIQNERRARGNGALYYTAKPIQPDELRIIVKAFMNRLRCPGGAESLTSGTSNIINEPAPLSSPPARRGKFSIVRKGHPR